MEKDMRFVMRGAASNNAEAANNNAQGNAMHQEMANDNMENEMRRRSRSAYEQGYEDARRDAEMRRARSIEDDYLEMRRGRRSRSEAEDTGRAEARGQSVMPESPKPWQNLSEARQIGFARGEAQELAQMKHDIAQMKEKLLGKGMAAAQELDPRLEHILAKAMQVMEMPPSTWTPYLEKKEYEGIVRMEGKELMTALEEGKSMKDIKKELTHTIAALFQMISA